MTAGQEFVKMLKPAGCVIFLVLFAAFMIMCLKPPEVPIKGYNVPHTSDYYEEHLDELKTELEKNVFPKLDGEESCLIQDGKLIVTLEPEHFDASSGAIIYYYTDELFSFRKTV